MLSTFARREIAMQSLLLTCYNRFKRRYDMGDAGAMLLAMLMLVWLAYCSSSPSAPRSVASFSSSSSSLCDCADLNVADSFPVA